MSRRQLVFLAAILSLAILVTWVAVRTRQPPILPADATHASFVSPQACLTCHGPDGPVPQPPNHPLGTDCARCHGFRK